MDIHKYHGHATLVGRIIIFLAIFDEIDLLTPLMTSDREEKKYTRTQAKCIVPVSIKKFCYF